MLDGFVKRPYAVLLFIPRHCDVPVEVTLGGCPKAFAVCVSAFREIANA